MKNKIILFILMLLVLPKSINAVVISTCPTSLLADLKSIANNINLSYDYEIQNNQAYFKVTINNLNNKIYIIDSQGNRYSTNSASNVEVLTNKYGNIEKISFRIYSNVDKCKNDLLVTKYINLPVYNPYYKDKECETIQDFKLCQKWYKHNEDYDTFLQKVKDYKNKKNVKPQTQVQQQEEAKGIFDTIYEIYINYYYIILPILIVVCLTIMYIKNKNNKLAL